MYFGVILIFSPNHHFKLVIYGAEEADLFVLQTNCLSFFFGFANLFAPFLLFFSSLLYIKLFGVN